MIPWWWTDRMLAFRSRLLLLVFSAGCGRAIVSDAGDVSTDSVAEAAGVSESSFREARGSDVAATEAATDVNSEGGDGGIRDASDGATAADGGSAICGKRVCNPGEFCRTQSAGGWYESFACTAIPPSCEPDPSCPCIASALPGVCGAYYGSCETFDGGHIVVNCIYPP